MTGAEWRTCDLWDRFDVRNRAKLRSRRAASRGRVIVAAVAARGLPAGRPPAVHPSERPDYSLNL